MNAKVIVGVLVAILAVVLLTKGFFVVRPDQFAIVTEFGEPVDVISSPRCIEPEGADPNSDDCKNVLHRPKAGFYFRIPFIQEVRYLDARVRGWDDEARDTKTVELRTIDFIAFARWRIIEPLKFYTAAKTEKKAMGGMDSIVTARIQTAIRQNKLGAIVRDRGRNFEARASLNLLQLVNDYSECRPENDIAIKQIIERERLAASARKATTDDTDAQRAEIVEAIRKAANVKLREEFGIKIEDLHFKYLNYSRQVHAKMIDAIKQDRRRDIEQYKKIGKTCAGTIEAAREQEKGKILGEKDRTVRRIIGDAQAEAIKLKAQAFNRNPEFFKFLRTLEVYQKSLQGGTRLVLSADSPLLALMKDKSLLAPVKSIDLPEVPPKGGAGKDGKPNEDGSKSKPDDAKPDDAKKDAKADNKDDAKADREAKAEDDAKAAAKDEDAKGDKAPKAASKKP